MTQPDLTLLLTRPRADSERFFGSLPETLRARVVPLISPLIRIVPLSEDLGLEGVCGLLLTSQNAVAAVSRLTGSRHLPCYCVGAATTDAARRNGWQARMAGETANELVASLLQSPPPGPLLHLRGRHTSGDVVGRLSAGGCPARAQAIYDQQLLPLSQMAQERLRGRAPVIVPLFSPRTARHFAGQCNASAPLYLGAISDAAAEPLARLNIQALEIASRPDATAMAELIEKLVNRACRVEGEGRAQ